MFADFYKLADIQKNLMKILLGVIAYSVNIAVKKIVNLKSVKTNKTFLDFFRKIEFLAKQINVLNYIYRFYLPAYCGKNLFNLRHFDGFLELA